MKINNAPINASWGDNRKRCQRYIRDATTIFKYGTVFEGYCSVTYITLTFYIIANFLVLNAVFLFIFGIARSTGKIPNQCTNHQRYKDSYKSR